jgi:O-antigen/teichoic acid export membrane protein
MIFSKRKIVIHSVIYTILPKISVITALLILPLISPYLTLEDYGLYGILMSYVSVFQMLIGLGQVVLLQNSFFSYKNNYKLIWRRSFAIMILAGIFSSILLALLLNFTLADKLGSNLLIIIVLMSIYLILTPLDSIVINYYTLQENPIPYAIIMGIIGFITTFVTYFTIRHLAMGYLGWVITLPTTVVFTNIFFFRKIYFVERIYPEFRFNKRFFYKSLKIGLPLTPHQLSLYILSVSDRLLLEFYKIPIKQIGFYSQGYNIGSMGNIVVNGVFQALSKKIQQGFRSEEKRDINFIRNLIIIIPISISSIFFLGALWSKEIFFLLFRNVDLQNSYSITIVVLGSYMFLSIYTFFSYSLLVKNQIFAISKITLIAAIFNIIANVILIPLYGIWASLGVTYLSYIIFGFAGLLNKKNRLFLNKYININKACLFFFIFNVFLLFFSYSFMDSSISIKFFFSLLLLFIGLLIKNIFKKYQ